MKLFAGVNVNQALQSHPSRGAWIETTAQSNPMFMTPVAPLAGCVD